MIEDFLLELDKRWKIPTQESIALHVVGSMALFLQSSYQRNTKDSDILEIEEIPTEIRNNLIKLAGRETQLAKKYGLYLDIIKSGKLFLPARKNFHPYKALNTKLKNFSFLVLDVTDVVVSKLMPFRQQDVQDIQAVIDLGLIEPARLIERFIMAKEQCLLDSRAADLPKYIENLNTVQRDFLDVEETFIEVPSWVEEI